MGNTMAIEESFFFFYLTPATGLQFIIKRELFAGVMAQSAIVKNIGYIVYQGAIFVANHH